MLYCPTCNFHGTPDQFKKGPWPHDHVLVCSDGTVIKKGDEVPCCPTCGNVAYEMQPGGRVI